MRRPLATFLLLLCLFWQAIAVAGQVPAFASQEEIAHAALHLQEAAHHHHDDGSVTVDDSDDSKSHVVADGLAGVALVSFVTEAMTADWTSTPPTLDEVRHTNPALEGPRRPPKLKA
jgi:hypothetical protein